MIGPKVSLFIILRPVKGAAKNDLVIHECSYIESQENRRETKAMNMTEFMSGKFPQAAKNMMEKMLYAM